jgi:DNA-binding MarR family transcriptional regulator
MPAHDRTPQPVPRASDDTTAPERAELVDALVRASFATMAVLNRIGAEHDLSLTQVRVLGILRDRRVRMTELADHLGLDKSTVSGLVDRAVKRGLLQRSPHAQDGRAVEVHITARGSELAELGAAELARALAPMTDGLTPAQARRLTALLDQLLGPAPRPPRPVLTTSPSSPVRPSPDARRGPA